MKLKVKWIALVLVVVLLAAGAVKMFTAKSAQKQTLQAQQAAQANAPMVQLSATDLLDVEEIDLQQGLTISGQIKAFDSAFVKARVAGELRELLVREGDFVKAGQVIARIDATEYLARVRQAQQQAEAAKAQVDIAKRSFDNNRALVDQGFISKTGLDASSASLAGAQATFLAAQAGADLAQKSLDDALVRAPISGQISQRLVQSGERVAVEARIVEIVNLSRLELEISLAASDSVNIKVGQKALLSVESSGQTISATVARLNPSATIGSRAVLVYLSLDKSAQLRQGLYAQGLLSTGNQRGIAIPLSAVRTDKPQPYVQVLESGKIQHQIVELGNRGEYQGKTMVAVTGLALGKKILTGGTGPMTVGTLINTESAK
ncbi:MAG: efflux RND transporter periplasmic adaptor subunit [Comamonadaceae bacterium]|nr:MAG: efflux RND transporter periplasmic adaptor subunit [Comamonadaceae bacterium]